MDTLIVVGVWCFLCAMICSVIAERKGQPIFMGFLAGLLLGPVGIIVMVCQRRLPACPACGTRVRAPGAYICPACNRDVRDPAIMRHVTHA